ncbi:MAG: cell wall hydrolase [Candidatus Hinthialibacter antarcticus]|nr:cell wall hydrolase [Candidatus Hinthialibacter antarcticus]
MRTLFRLVFVALAFHSCSTSTVITPIGNFSYEPSVLPVVGLESSGGGVGIGVGDHFIKTGDDVYVTTDRNIKNLYTVAEHFLPEPMNQDEAQKLSRYISFPGVSLSSRLIQDSTPGGEVYLPNQSESLKKQKEITLMTMCVYGEARGEPFEGKLAVAKVIMNRVAEGGWYGRSIKDVVLKPYQFSCFNTWDPNFTKLFQPNKRIWKQCFKAAWNAYSEMMDDPTVGATHYCVHKINPPWVRAMKETNRIGNHKFFRTSQSAMLDWWNQYASIPESDLKDPLNYDPWLEHLRIFALIEPSPRMEQKFNVVPAVFQPF